MKGLIRDGVSRTVRVDPVTGSLKTVDYQHAEIHGGNAFHCSQRKAANAFDIASPMSYLIVTPNTTKWAHLVVTGEANTPAYVDIIEDSGSASTFDVTGGTGVTEYNRNRNSTTAATVVVTHTPTMTQSSANIIETFTLGKSSLSGERHEFILKQNTKYLVRATSYADNNEGSLSLDWYEHTSRD